MDNAATQMESDMNGWQRLWVLMSFLLGVGTVIMGYGSMETESELTNWYKAERDMRTGEILSIYHKAMGIKPLNAYDTPSHTVAELQGMIKQLDVDHQQNIERLPSKQLRHASIYLVIWLGTCVSIYLAGMMLNWVYRGFRPKVV